MYNLCGCGGAVGGTGRLTVSCPSTMCCGRGRRKGVRSPSASWKNKIYVFRLAFTYPMRSRARCPLFDDDGTAVVTQRRLRAVEVGRPHALHVQGGEGKKTRGIGSVNVCGMDGSRRHHCYIFSCSWAPVFPYLPLARTCHLICVPLT